MNLKLPSMMKGWLKPNVTPEKLLMDYVATGNKKQLSLLVAQFNLSLYHYLLSLSDKELAEDALQSTWLKVMHTTNSHHSNVRSWLYTIARRTLIDELKRQQRWQWQEVSDEQLKSRDLQDDLSEQDKLATFNHAIASLPFHQREAFIFQQEGFSVAEISVLTDENFETVKSRLRYARNQLKTFLGKNYE